MFALFATHCLHIQQHTQFFKGLFAVTLLYILFYLSTLLFVVAFQKMPKQAASGKTKVNAFIIDMGHSLPSESTSRRIVENIAKEEDNQMIYNFTNKDIFIVIDEAEVDGK